MLKKIFFNKNLLIIIFLYILLEGSIRKWIFPGVNFEIIFLRDLLILYSLFYGTIKRVFLFEQWQEKLLLRFSFIVLFWSIIQITFLDINFFVCLIGLRNYIIYPWLSLFIYRFLDNQSFINLIKIILFTIIPISILTTLQANLPIDHFINLQATYNLDYVTYKNFIKDSYTAFVVSGVPRTTGTFSYFYGHVQYLKFLFPLVILLFEQSFIEIFSKNKIKFIITICFLIAIIFSGARQVILYSVLIIFLYFLLKIIFDNFNKNLKSLILLFFLLILSYLLFPTPFNSMIERFYVASLSESTVIRVFQMIHGSNESWENFVFLGNGLGAGSNIASFFFDNTRFMLGEFESDRMIGEGGLFGIIILLIKFFISILIMSKTFIFFVKEKFIFPFIFSVYISLQLILVQITGQLTTQAITFFSIGLFFYTLKISRNFKKQKNF